VIASVHAQRYLFHSPSILRVVEGALRCLGTGARVKESTPHGARARRTPCTGRRGGRYAVSALESSTMTPRPLTALIASLALGFAAEVAAADRHAAEKDGPEKHASEKGAPEKRAIEKTAIEKSATEKSAPEKTTKALAPRNARPSATSARANEDGAALEALRERLARKLEATRVANATTPSVRVVAKADPSMAAGHAPAAAPAVRQPAKPPGHDNAAGGHAHWGYQGETGPDAWGRMQPEFATCANGQRQSPIDIRGGIRVDLEPVQFDYRASRFAVVDNGHTVQVNVEAGNAITAMGRRFDLVQFHFHRPSEERIDGRQFDMVAHLVHKNAEGKLAVVAVLLDRGSTHPLVQTVWNNLPLEKGDEVRASGTLDLANLLPQDRRYHTYMGSLTTPPCSEGVTWIVMAQPVAISSEQIGVFSHLYPMNARPVQAASGRLIKSSN
jgi:carbonic anhydrase